MNYKLFFKKAISVVPIIIIGICIIFLLFLTNFKDLTWNDRSRLATIQSLVEYHTFSIDNSVFDTGDKVFSKGHFFSDKPPLLSVFLAGVYLPFYYSGITFATYPNWVIYILTLSASTVPYIIYLFFVFKFSFQNLNTSKLKNIFLVIVLGLGTSLFSYATILNNHLLAGILCGIGGMIFLSKESFQQKFLVGLIMGFATTIDPAALFIGGIFGISIVYITFKKREIKKTAQNSLLLVVGFCLPLLLHGIINNFITGDFLPASMHPELFNYPGSYFTPEKLTNATLAVSNFNEWVGYMYNLLFGKRGIIVLNPLVALGLGTSIYYIFKKDSDYIFRIYCLISISSFFSVVLYYSLYGKDFGGPSYTVRWLIISIPIFFPILLRYAFSRKWALYIVATCAVVGAIWNVPASLDVFTNLNGYQTWQGKLVLQRFPKNFIKHTLEWKKLIKIKYAI